MGARNFPYEGPNSLYDLCMRGVDRYRANYDKVFGPAYTTEEMAKRKRKIEKKLNRELSEQIAKA